MDLISDITLIGGISGFISIIWNWINSRREKIENLRPKINMESTLKPTNNTLFSLTDLENIGTSSIDIRGIQIDASSESFEEGVYFGPTIYSTDLLVFDSKILNSLKEWELELNLENLSKCLKTILGGNLTEEFSNDALNQILEKKKELKGESKGLLIRTFFLIKENLESISTSSKIKIQDLPEKIEEIVLDEENYKKSRYKPAYNSIDSKLFRIEYEQNPVWSKTGKKLYTVTPEEMGIPKSVAPAEKRNLSFKIQINKKTNYEVILTYKFYILSYIPRLFILKREVITMVLFNVVTM